MTDGSLKLSPTVTLFILTLAAPVVATSSDSLVWTAKEITTSVDFSPELLDALGLEVKGLSSSADSVPHHKLSVSSSSAPAFRSPQPHFLSFSATGTVIDDFVSGAPHHQGGFHLSWRAGSVSLMGFQLRPGSGIRTFELLDTEGRVLLVADHMHFELDPEGRTLLIFNMDLKISETFSRLLGKPWAQHARVGTLSLFARAEPPEGTSPTRGICPPNWVGEVDVALLSINSLGQVARSGGQVVAAPSASLKNVGTADVPWHSKFSGSFPPHSNDQHPFLVWALYRIHGGRVEQLGRSDVKHAFLTLNTNCTGCSADNNILGLGCEDVYGQGTNASNNSLAPRSEITAHTGLWTHCDEPPPGPNPSHFDVDGNCVQDHAGAGEDAFSHGMVIEEADLQVAGAQYFIEAWYVVRDDVDIFNTMGYHEVAPSLNGSLWSFPIQSVTLTKGPALDAWVDPTTTDPNEQNTVYSSADGHLQLAVQVTGLGGGQYRYEYALMNLDFDRQVQAFSVPVPTTALLTDISFRDLDADPVNDWTAGTSNGALTWTSPVPENALDWGTLYNFAFTANIAAGTGTSVLSPLEGVEPGPAVATLAPLALKGIFSDGFESGDTTGWE